MTTKSIEKLLTAIWVHSDSGYAVVDRDGKYLRVNPVYSELLEYSESEMVGVGESGGMKISDVTHPSEFIVAQDMFQSLLDKKRDSYVMMKSLVTKFGKTLHARVKKIAIYDDDGNVDCVLAHITEPVYLMSNNEKPTPIYIGGSSWWERITQNWSTSFWKTASIALGIVGVLATILWNLIAWFIRVSDKLDIPLPFDVGG